MIKVVMWVAQRIEGPSIATQGGHDAVTVTFKDKDTGQEKVLLWEVPTGTPYAGALLKELMCDNGLQPNDIGPCV